MIVAIHESNSVTSHRYDVRNSFSTLGSNVMVSWCRLSFFFPVSKTTESDGTCSDVCRQCDVSVLIYA